MKILNAHAQYGGFANKTKIFPHKIFENEYFENETKANYGIIQTRIVMKVLPENQKHFTLA